MFTLSLVTPNKRLLTDVEVDEVIVPAYRGQLDILPGHAPLVSTLTAGVIKVRLKGETKFKVAATSWGYLEVNPRGVVILADTAQWPEEISRDKAQKDYEHATQRLQEAGLAPDEKVLAQRQLDLEKARLEVLEH